MSARTQGGTRVVVISDLHLANGQPDLIADPRLLETFIHQLDRIFPVDINRGEKLELVINGDFVDFLNIQEYSEWTPDPAQAVKKLLDVTDRSRFSGVFDALGELVAKGHLLTMVLGNHDIELALPAVHAAFLSRIGADPRKVLWLTDGRAHRIGSVLIEHGNRYDDANVNDYDGLRALVSAQSRGEQAARPLEVSAGSKLVLHVVNRLKDTYPFVNLLQPLGELLLLLLLELEPSLSWEMDMLRRLLRGKQLAERNQAGAQPKKTTNVSAGSEAEDDAATVQAEEAELQATFGETRTQLRQRAENVAAGALLQSMFRPGGDGMAALLRRGEAIPLERLRRLRVALKRILDSDESGRIDSLEGPCARAAKRLLRNGKELEAVVMGHTHLPRFVQTEGGVYINTGTWIDRLRFPKAVVEEGQERALEEYLRALCEDRRAASPPTCGELRIDESGALRGAALHELRLSGDAKAVEQTVVRGIGQPQGTV
jgi:UDP-2,3-diacylglucosamine pyrophosphatase LpxH